MLLWQRLYNVIWLAFFDCLLVRRWFGSWVVLVLHVLIGVALLVLTQVNARELAAKACPDRLKRISAITAKLAIVQAVLGVGLGALGHFDVHWLIPRLAGAFHLVVALAILAQASSTATGHDMWEEREWTPEPPAPPATPEAEPAAGS